MLQYINSLYQSCYNYFFFNCNPTSITILVSGQQNAGITTFSTKVTRNEIFVGATVRCRYENIIVDGCKILSSQDPFYRPQCRELNLSQADAIIYLVDESAPETYKSALDDIIGLISRSEVKPIPIVGNKIDKVKDGQMEQFNETFSVESLVLTNAIKVTHFSIKLGTFPLENYRWLVDKVKDKHLLYARRLPKVSNTSLSIILNARFADVVVKFCR
jgi:GTPase SAR1 family protein